MRQCCGNLALSRFGPSGLAIHGGSVDVGNHEATAETSGDDGALYLVGRRCCAWKFDYQEWSREIVILSDAEWLSDSERRRSVDCVHIYGRTLD